jgi:hypothetical protein
MKFLKAFLVAAIGSVIANLIILFVLRPIVINPAMPLHALSVGPVTGLTIFGVIGAAIVYAIMRAFMARPQKAFISVAVIVLIVSLIPDYMVIGVTTGPFAGGSLPTALTLMLMHVVEAIIVVAAFVKIWGSKNAPVA